MSNDRWIAVWLQTDGIGTLTMTDAQAECLEGLCPGWRVAQCHSEAEFTAALPLATAAVTWVFRQEWFALAPRLKLVATPAAGKDYFAVEWPKGMRHWNGTYHGELMAESAVGMLLAMCRGLLPAVTTYADRPWPRHEIDALARPLRGSTVTICGFGHIGRWIGRLLKPFGVHLNGVAAHSGHAAPDYFTDGDECHAVAELDALLPWTDHLVLALPRDRTTDALLSAHRLALLPRHATVVNVGRGNAIDEAALTAALRAGQLAGACLDVVATEPLPADSPLRTCPNLWITPHSSAFGQNYMMLFAREFAARLQTEGA
jgi:phosphoglycerate dehydrogenase-like enzyme